jgi:hypothetical protein
MAGRRPPQVGTIGSTIADGLHMTIVCDAIGCHNRKTVDLEALRLELGEDYRIADFVARAKCSKCGAKWPKLPVKVGAIHTGGMR